MDTRTAIRLTGTVVMTFIFYRWHGMEGLVLGLGCIMALVP